MTSVGIRCDAGPAIGVGHLVRCVALAEELTARGVAVRFLGDLGGLAWARRQLETRGLPWQPGPPTPEAFAAAARELRLDAVVLDSYDLPPGYGAAVRAPGRTVVAIVDGEPRGQVADVYVDQNLGAESAPMPVPPGAVRLAGLRFALLRDAVRALRPVDPRPARVGRVPRVVCFFGGTDAFRAAPTVTRLLLATGVDLDAVVVAADAGIRAELATLSASAGQRLTVIDPTDDLPALLAGADLAVSASGTSAWELCCLGLPCALVWVADNQRLGYRRAVERDLVAGLGRLTDLTEGREAGRCATAVLRDLLTDARLRAALGRRGWAAVDGRGRQRVADEILRRLAVCAPGRG